MTYTVAEAGPEAIKDIELLSNEKTYILHNPIEKCYAVFANEKSLNNIWVANEEGSRNFPNGVTLDPNSASSAWMAIKVKGNFYLYNMGAQKYLETRDYIGNGNLSGPATFIKDFKPVTVVTRADGYLAFTTHADDSKSFLCASTSFDEAHAPMANWSSSDPGCVRQFEENPNIAANPAIVEKITYIIEQSLLLNEEAGDIYNLNGIKMQPGSKLEKGVYIKNGKKVVVK